ncbi:hypothetical protein [Pontimicrobium aquaticum]|uniref:Uncharacterized protein n=1 Tax=Pontimicrobium aquaticum TaxID=2565367 RepID=A0A4U0EVG7_9FLAO|nr:hypothetical protein [Pontimicrobium aquaticum]TJY35901.1 hypothetical protein E5167_08515 [Pontimicrobium aquaticum]
MEYKIIATTSNTKEELLDLFNLGKPLPGLKISPVEKKGKSIYAKPFGNVLTSNKHIVKGKLNFNGEPFLKGKFEYMQVLLPESRTNSLFLFYPILTAIINGYYYCTKAKKESLISLANQIYHFYAPINHVFKQTEERTKSFKKIEDIVNKVVSEPFPFDGRKKYLNIVWNPDYELSPQEKTDLCNKDSGKKKLNKNLQILLEAYKDGMTQIQLSDASKISLSTVKRRWTTIMEHNKKNNKYLCAA